MFNFTADPQRSSTTFQSSPTQTEYFDLAASLLPARYPLVDNFPLGAYRSAYYHILGVMSAVVSGKSMMSTRSTIRPTGKKADKEPSTKTADKVRYMSMYVRKFVNTVLFFL